MVKNLPANAGGLKDVSSIPGLGRSSGEGHGNPLQYSCLENRMEYIRDHTHSVILNTVQTNISLAI